MRNRQTNSPPPALLSELVGLANAGQWPQLEAKAQMAAMRYPAQLFIWKTLGVAFLHQGKLKRALETFARIVKLAPGDADSHNYMGVICRDLGRLDEAEAAFRRSLEAAGNQPESTTLRSLALTNLGIVLTDVGKHAEAVACHRAALELKPGVAETYNNLGTALRDAGQLEEAVAAYRQAVTLTPAYFDARFNLGVALRELGLLREAEIEYRTALEIRPHSAIVLRGLGTLLGRYLGQPDEGLVLLERALQLEPDSADAHIELGNLLQTRGDASRGWALFQQAQVLRPLTTWLARTRPAKFSVVALDTPGVGSTPFEYLLGKADYDVHFYCVLPDVPADLELLRAKGNVLINLIADADNGSNFLPVAEALVDRIGRPVVNHPHAVKGTDRESMALRLAGIPGFCSPLTQRFKGAALAEAATSGGLSAFTLPVIARFAGTHGGDDLDKYDDYTALATFALVRPEGDYYLSDYIDYRSADGYFRKYRLIYIDGQLFPYHLAILNEWKVHYFRTDAANQSWMRREEEAFLNAPNSVFDEARYAQLCQVISETGLDYCGIDCAITPNKEILIFEANAAMLVHDEKQETYLYKNPFAKNIKQAYEAMLTKKASEGV